jgi:hypothetical protein
MIKKITIFAVWVITLTGIVKLHAQEIYLSREIDFNMQDEFRLLGEVSDTLLLFRQAADHYELETYTENLEYLFTKELFFEKQRIHVNGMVADDSGFTMIYSYEDRFNLQVRARHYDVRGELIDSTNLFRERDYLDIEHFSSFTSEDKKRILLYRSTRYDRLELMMFDRTRHEMLWYRKLVFPEYNVSADLNGMLLTNDGLVVLVFGQNNYIYQRKNHFQHVYILDPAGEEAMEFKVPFEGKLSVGFYLVSDERNKEVIVAGLYSQRSANRAYGYYLYKFNGGGITQSIRFEPFRQQLLNEYSVKSRKTRKYVPDLQVRNILLRNDGGMVLVTEKRKEILRESVRRRYIDYHYEDIVLLALHPEGELFWDELIRKYQLSYDDRAMFSSFFLFENPSRVRIVFNDEIKSENTISEFVFSPLGGGKRSSLLSTDLHRLKLVFEDAMQIRPDAFIVPSIYNSKFRIVLVRY